MKKIIFFTLLLLIYSCSEENEVFCDTTPSFDSINSLEISYNSFRISGSINTSDCDDNFISKGIVYSKSELPTTSDQKIIFSDIDFSVEVENLLPATKYYVRAFLTNQDGEFYSNQITATTLNIGVEFSQIESTPMINTTEISGLFNFIEGGGYDIISRGIIFNGNKVVDNNSTNNSIKVKLEGLTPDTDYSFQTFVSSQYGDFKSTEQFFKTESSNTTISNIVASNISYASFELNATYSNLYTGDDITTSKGFIVSSDSDFSNPVTFSSTSNEGIINAITEQLNSNTTYYVKAYVENNFSTSYSEVLEVSTISAGYNFTAPIVNNISYTTASLYTQTINPTDLDIIEKGFYISTSTDFNDNFQILKDDVTTNKSEAKFDVTGLNTNTTYYVKTYVINQYGTFTSDFESFTTTEVSYNFETISVTNISFETASLSSGFNLNYGNLDTTEKGFYISTSTDFNSFTTISDSSNDSNIASDLLDLNFNSKYYIKAFVKNEFGVFTSDIQSFQTLNSGYNFSNMEESNLTYSSVDLSGSFSHINTEETDVIEFGFYVSANESELNSNSIKVQTGTDLIISLSNLNHNTKYYYQAFIKNKFGEFKSNTFNFTTLDATPVFNFDLPSNNINLSEVSPTIDIQIKDQTDINSLIINYIRTNDGYSKDLNFLNEVDNNYEGGEQSFTINELLPKTTYLLKIILKNDYGEYESNEYSFTTLDDTPSVTYSVNKSEDNSVDVVANFTALDGASINRAFIEYKNQEQSSYNRIELAVDDNNLNIDNLIQGPQYDFKLTIQNEWNTYSYNEYLSLDVTYEVGDEMFGGIIVDIDESGYHGIIMAKSSFIVSRVWSTNYHKFDNYATQYKMGKGKEDSKIILEHYNSVSDSAPAFEYCENIVISGYDDWYLPSIKELTTGSRVLNITDLGRFWSSTEDPNSFERAYRLISTATIQPNDKKSEELVLPFRQF